MWVADGYGAGGLGQKISKLLAHLLRDTRYVIGEGDGVFAPALRHFIGVACDEAARRDTWNDATLKIHKRGL